MFIMKNKKELDLNRDENIKEYSKKSKKVEKVSAESIVKDDEPSWYHYLIVIVVFILVGSGIYYTYDFIENFGEVDIPLDNLTNITKPAELFNYPYKVGNVTYNIKFHNSIEDIESMDYIIEPNRMDILNTISIDMSFYDYNGTDNGQVSTGSTTLLSFLKLVYHFNFDAESFKMYNETNCSDSSMRDKIIMFNPYVNQTGVFMDDNGCIEILSDEPAKIVDLVDKFIYTLVKEDEND